MAVKKADLKKYKDSKEWKEICERCDNKQTAYESKVIESYSEWDVDNEGRFSMYDVFWRRVEFHSSILEEIKDESEWARALRKRLTDKVDSDQKFIKMKIVDDFGLAYSTPKFSELDMIRWDAQNTYFFKEMLDQMISELEKPKEKDNSVY